MKCNHNHLPYNAAGFLSPVSGFHSVYKLIGDFKTLNKALIQSFSSPYDLTLLIPSIYTCVGKWSLLLIYAANPRV